MELNWLGGHSKIDAVQAYLSSTSSLFAIGISAADDFVPILVFQDLDAAAKFANRLNDLVVYQIKQTAYKSQPERTEVPEVFKKAFGSDDSVSGRKH